MNNLMYVSLGNNDIEVSKEAVLSFKSGNSNIDEFLHERAEKWAVNGYGVTYILVSQEEVEKKKIQNIYAFATISCAGLLYEIQDDVRKYLSCAEIKYFAIRKAFRGVPDSDGIRYSKKFFQILLQDLYFMSMNIIGFKMLFLQANHEGYKLYDSYGFKEIEDMLVPNEDDKIQVEGCTPLGMMLTEDNYYDLFLDL